MIKDIGFNCIIPGIVIGLCSLAISSHFAIAKSGFLMNALFWIGYATLLVLISYGLSSLFGKFGYVDLSGKSIFWLNILFVSIFPEYLKWARPDVSARDIDEVCHYFYAFSLPMALIYIFIQIALRLRIRISAAMSAIVFGYYYAGILYG